MGGTTHEERANWIRRGFILLLAAAVGAGAWFYQKKPEPKKVEETTTEKLAIVYDLEIIHYHEPVGADSVVVVENLDRIAQKYNKQVHVTHVDITTEKQATKEEGMTPAQ